MRPGMEGWGCEFKCEFECEFECECECVRLYFKSFIIEDSEIIELSLIEILNNLRLN